MIRCDYKYGVILVDSEHFQSTFRALSGQLQIVYMSINIIISLIKESVKD